MSPGNDDTNLSHNDESLEIAIIDIRVLLLIIMAASCCNSIIKKNENEVLSIAQPMPLKEISTVATLPISGASKTCANVIR
jgi:hypothetical protein